MPHLSIWQDDAGQGLSGLVMDANLENRSLADDRLRRCPYVDEKAIETNYVFLHPEKHAHLVSVLVTSDNSPSIR